MVKNLHYATDKESIIDDLKSQGFNVLDAQNKLKFKTKQPLNMFVLSFDSKEDIQKIFKIRSICHSIVQIEEIKQQRVLPQCKQCQSFGHTKNYCNKPPRCVKCAGKHNSYECDKEIDRPKCCNCGEQHPASYRGCQVAKELQKLRNKKLQSTSKRTIPYTNIPRNSNENPQSYASVTGNIASEAPNNILSQILSRLSTQENFFKTIEIRLANLEKTSNVSKHV